MGIRARLAISIFWVRPTELNAERVWQAIERFGAPRRGVIQADFHSPDAVFQIEVAPNRIDILTSITGVDFDHAWRNRIVITIDNLATSILGRDNLIANKRATGRPDNFFSTFSGLSRTAKAEQYTKMSCGGNTPSSAC